jgi:hypothetical protein
MFQFHWNSFNSKYWKFRKILKLFLSPWPKSLVLAQCVSLLQPVCPLFFLTPLSPTNIFIHGPTPKKNPRLSLIHVRHLPTSYPPPTTPSHAALTTSTATPDWLPHSQWSTKPNAVILSGGAASSCPLQYIQNSAWDHSWGEQDPLHISRCSLFWIQPAHALVNLSMFQSIPCLFWSIYHTTTCSLMLAMCSHKGDPKIHPDAPRNACGMPTIVGQVCRIITPWSSTQVTIHHNHPVFIMWHVTADSIVETIS